MYKKIYSGIKYLSLFVLIITVLMFFGISYEFFSNRIQQEISNEASLVASLINEADDPAVVLKNTDLTNITNRIVLKNTDGDVVFDSRAGSGNPIGGIYSEVTELSGGCILSISAENKDIRALFLTIGIMVVFIAFMIFGLTVLIARAVTNSIIDPIRNLDSSDENKISDTYDEFKPFLERIYGQDQEIERQMDKVRQQKLRLNTITENMSEGLVVLDENACILSVNQSVLRLLNIENADVKYKSFVNISEDEELNEGIKKALNGEKSNLIKNIKDKTYRVYFSPATENNKVSGAVLLMLDVTELIRAEEIRREFSANVSHELKTPVTTIHGYAQIINHGMAKPEMFENFIGKIEKESSRLITLIEDIIKLSNLDENNQDYVRDWVSLREIARKVAEHLSQNAAERNITLEVFGKDSMVYANEGGVNEIIYNLCDNAIKYNRDGGRVDIHIEENSITVSDTGIGIPEEYVSRIFERFFRVDKSHSKKVNGTGLGLSIVKHLAKNNNCEIEVKSKLNEGTAFKVKFMG